MSNRDKNKSNDLMGPINGMPDENPFQTTYQRTMGAASTTAQKPARSSTQQGEGKKQRIRPSTGITRSKSDASNAAFMRARKSVDPGTFGRKAPPVISKEEIEKTLKYLQSNRKFGSFGDYTEAKGVHVANQYLRSNSTHARLVPTGHHEGGKQTRCTDRFVRYSYPQQMRTKYVEMYERKNNRVVVKDHKKAWNLEKETKILNPGEMALYTTSAKAYRGKQERTERPRTVKHVEPPKPCNKESAYAKSFPHWGNGKQDVYHEKEPQFPCYQLPFHGKSSYQAQYTTDQTKAFVGQQESLKELVNNKKQSANKLALGSYQQAPFNYATTNNEKLKDFQIATQFINDQQNYQSKSSGDQPGKRVHQAVRTGSIPGHFRTVCQKTWVSHQSKYKRSKADSIPYP